MRRIVNSMWPKEDVGFFYWTFNLDFFLTLTTTPFSRDKVILLLCFYGNKLLFRCDYILYENYSLIV